jgi:hypothetical protein
MTMASFVVAPFSAQGATANSTPTGVHAKVDTGLRFYQVNGRRYGILTAIHVVTFSAPSYTVKIGLAHNEIDGGLQTPSTMCRSTVGCVAAVNGDFFNATPRGRPDPGDEVGGIIQNCVLLHTPQISHQQVDLDGPSLDANLNWRSSVDVNGVNVPITAINQELPMDYVGVHLLLAGTLLFTSQYALATPSSVGWITDEFSQVDPTASPTTINATSQLQLVAQTTRAVRVAPGQVDISMEVASPLATLPIGAIVSLSTTSTSGCDSLGGHPILLDDGVVQLTAPAEAYMAGSYARTLIGWTASGETMIMTIDGKDGVSGATAYQLAYFLQSLGVVTALEVDGGNSTTLYGEGRTLNKPSEGKERPVSTSLLVVGTSS